MASYAQCNGVRGRSAELRSAVADAAIAVELCVDCVDDLGLCVVHRPHVCPRLSRAAWLRLIGESLVEQRARQDRTDAKTRAASPAELRAVAKVQRRNARKARRLAPLLAAMRIAA